MAAITAVVIGALVTAAAATVHSTIAQQQAASKDRRAKRRAEDVQRALANINRAREIRQGIAQARVAAASSQAQAFASGTDRGSALPGAVGSLFTNTASQIGFTSTVQAANQLQSDILYEGQRDVQKRINKAQNLAALASVSKSVGTAAGSGTFGA